MCIMDRLPTIEEYNAQFKTPRRVRLKCEPLLEANRRIVREPYVNYRTGPDETDIG